MAESVSSSKQTLTGSCICNKIKYEIAVELPLTVQRCNCTICAKPGHTSLKLDPSDFKLISPASKSDLSCYIANPAKPETNNRYFCPDCGVTLCMEGAYEWQGQTFHHFAVSATTLDQPQSSLELSEVKVVYLDGLHDNQMAGYQDTPWSGGMI